MFRRVMLLAAIAAAATITGAGIATASHTGYWFYQGNLPDGGGVRSKLHGDHPPSIDLRVSWSGCTHDMVALIIDNGGGWGGVTFFYGFGCDQSWHVDYPEFSNNYGCQNPPNNTEVFANCRVGSGV